MFVGTTSLNVSLAIDLFELFEFLRYRKDSQLGSRKFVSAGPLSL